MKPGLALAPVLGLLLLGCAGGGGAGVAENPPPTGLTDFTPSNPRLDRDALLADLKAISDPALEGRKLGSPGNARARDLIVQRLSALGIEGCGGSLVQPFTWRGEGGANVVGRIRGSRHPEQAVIFSCHYDHIGIRNGEVCPGADDNGSGTAALLRLAEWLQAHPPAHTVLFCFFDGEEAGLYGSQAFVAAPPVPLPSIAVVLNLDMIAQGTQGRIFVGGTSYTASLKPTLLSAYASSKVAVVPDFERYDNASDQYPFMRQGVPFLFWCVGDDDPWYHTPSDSFANIPGTFYWASVEAVLETFLRLDAQDQLQALLPHAPPRPPDGRQGRLEPHPWRRSLARPD